jgi:hypothetical protein
VTGGENVIMAIYLGGGALNVMYGGTIIDGTQITTRSVSANRVQANSITATELIQTESIIVNQAMIANATIGTLKVLDGDMTSVLGSGNDIIAYTDVQDLAPIVSIPGRRWLFTFVCSDAQNERGPYFALPQIGTSRLVEAWVRGDVTGDHLIGQSYSWDSITGGGPSGGWYLRASNIVGSFVYTTGAADSGHVFYAKNVSGLQLWMQVTATALKR